jgi:hypothetical protein
MRVIEKPAAHKWGTALADTGRVLGTYKTTVLDDPANSVLLEKRITSNVFIE